MKTGLLGVMIAVTILACFVASAAPAAEGEIPGDSVSPFVGITGPSISCGNIGAGPAGILALLAAWIAARGKSSGRK